MKRRVIAILLTVVMSVNVFSIPAFAEEPEETTPKDYVLEENGVNCEDVQTGADDADVEMDLEELKMQDAVSEEKEDELHTVSFASASAIPESFHTDAVNEKDKVGNQGKWNSSWAFAGLTNLERCMEKDTKKKYNFSEEYMLHKASVFGDMGYAMKSKKDGGNAAMAIAYLEGMNGIMDESAYPYNREEDLSDSYSLDGKSHLRVTDYMQFRTEDASIFEADRSLTPEGVQTVKTAIMEQGSVIAGICWTDTLVQHEGTGVEAETYKKETGAYSYGAKNGVDNINHQVVIVGWDDNYPKENFVEGTVKDNGAWVIQNSYGSDFGVNGYNYVSYEDTSILPMGTVVGFETLNNNERLHQHDHSAVRMGARARRFKATAQGQDGSACYGNVFQLSEKETLESVSIYLTAPAPGTEDLNRSGYPIDIYVAPVVPKAQGETTSKHIDNTKKQLVKAGFVPSYTGWHTLDVENVLLDSKEVAVYAYTPGVLMPDEKEGVHLRHNVLWMEYNNKQFDSRISKHESFTFAADEAFQFMNTTMLPAYISRDDKGAVNFEEGELGNIALKIKTKANHAWDDGVIVKEPTCSVAGVKEYHCTQDGCDATYTEDIPFDENTADKNRAHTGTEKITRWIFTDIIRI